MTAPARTARTAPRPAPTRERRPDLRVVAPPGRRARTTAIVCLAVVVVFGAMLASAVFNSVLVSSQAHLDQVNHSIVQERSDLERAKLALAQERSPARIAAEAQAMGMIPADKVVWVNQDGTSSTQVVSTPTTTVPATTTPAGGAR